MVKGGGSELSRQGIMTSFLYSQFRWEKKPLLFAFILRVQSLFRLFSVSIKGVLLACRSNLEVEGAITCIRLYTSAYVSIRQHTSWRSDPRQLHVCPSIGTYIRIRQHTSAYVSIRQRGSIRQHTSAYVRIRQHTSVRHLVARTLRACTNNAEANAENEKKKSSLKNSLLN